MPSRLERLDSEVRRLQSKVNKLTRSTAILREGRPGQMLRSSHKDLAWVDPGGEKDSEFLWPTTNDGNQEVNLQFGTYGEVTLIGATFLATDEATDEAGIYEFTFGYSNGVYKPLELFSSGSDDIIDVFEIHPYLDTDGMVTVKLTLLNSSISAAFVYRQSFAV